MGETQENKTCQNGQSSHFKYQPLLKKKEDVGVVVWDFKREKGNWHGDEKNQIFGKQMFA